MNIYRIENTSIRAAAHVTPGTPTTPKTLAVLLIVGDRNCLVEQYKSGTIVIILLTNTIFAEKVSKKLNLTTQPLSPSKV